MSETEPLKTSASHQDEQASRIDAVLLEYVQRRLEGESVSDDELIAAHPELLPDLGERLQILSKLRGEPQKTPATHSSSESGALNVRCPLCKRTVRLSSETCLENIICSGCGSQFSLDLPESQCVGSTGRLGHFELIERIGVGSFGAVWKACDTELDRIVAVKVPRQSRLEAEQLEQFLREARAAAQLNHPHIVSVHEIGREEDTVYIVSDLVDGVSLSDWLTDQKPTFREAAQLCHKIAAALEHAHQAGVIHRDLKPQNIMLDAEGEPRLLDFGLARRDVGEITMTVDGRVVGTPAYMSPEQARGEAHLTDRRTDVYSLGVILFELLTGALPFRGNTRMLLHQVLHDEPRQPRSLNDRIPRDLETVCLKAMAKESERRYQTASALADDLRRYLNGEPITSRPIGRTERIWRWVRRHPARAGFVVTCSVSLLALVGIVVGYTYQLNLRKANRDLEIALDATDQARTAAERFQYYQHIAAANAAWQEADMRRVNRLLDDCPLGYRHNWEWRYLKRQCHPEFFMLGEATEAWILAVTFSHDGTKLACGRDDGTVEIWDTAKRLIIRKFELRNDSLRDVEFSPGGTRLAAATLGETTRVWNVETGSTILDKNTGRGIAFSPDGKHLAAGPWILDAETGNEVTSIPNAGRVSRVTFDPSGDRIALGGENGLRIFDLSVDRDLFNLFQLSGGPQPARVWGIAYSPDGTRVAAGGDRGILAMWDATSGQQLVAPFVAHEGRIWGLQFSPDGSQLATASWDWTVKLWDGSNGKLLRTIMRRPTAYPVDAGRALFGVAYSPDGRILAISGQDGLVQICGTTESEVRILNGGEAAGQYVALSPDASRLVTGGIHTAAPSMAGKDNIVRILDRVTGQTIFELSHHVDDVRAITFSHDGAMLATAGDDGMVSICDVKSGGQRLRIDCPHPVYGVSFGPKGERIAAACEDGIRVWNAATGDPIYPLIQDERHRDSRVTSVAFSADGSRIASGNSWMVGVWNAMTGRLERPLLPSSHMGLGFNGVFHVAFSGNRVIATTRTCIRIWDVNTGEPVLDPITGHRGTFRSASISPDGQRLASVGADQTVRLWDMANGEPLLVIRGHTDEVLDVNFSKDGNWLVSISFDGTIRLLDARPLTPECSIEREAVSTMKFLLTKPLSKSDAIAYLQECPSIRPQARKMALELIDRYREETDPERFFHAAWGVVCRPYLNEFQYRFAHEQAKTACQLDPSRMVYQAALAMAQYRLGEKQQAGTMLARLQSALKNLVPAEHEDLAYLRAAKFLIEGQPTEPERSRR